MRPPSHHSDRRLLEVVWPLGVKFKALFIISCPFCFFVQMAKKKASPKKKKQVASKEQAQSNHQAVARNKRYVAHRSIFRELFRIERHMQPALPRLPFQRVVRQIAQNNNIRFCWVPFALLCLQESLEEWVIEFFEDPCFLSTHVHKK